MKSIRIAVLGTVVAALLTGCGSAGEATIAAPASPSPASASPAATPVAATTELPVTATVVVTQAAAPPPVTVTAPQPTIYTVTQTEQPPVIIVPDPTTVYPSADYYQYYSVGSLPDGLYCRDLKAMGYSFSDAITYWNYQGQPSRMDIDLNGIPCETVY